MAETWRGASTSQSVVTPPSKIQQRFEDSKLGEIVISGLVALFIIAGVVSNIPNSAIGRAVQPPVTPVAQATGLAEIWSMFAPNPPRAINSLEARVTMADGTTRIWAFKPPGRGPDLVAFDRTRNFEYFLPMRPSLRPAYLLWVVRKLTSPHERAVRAQLIETSESMLPPGVEGPRTTTTTTLWTIVEKDLEYWRLMRTTN
jgi:hypothetical protein